MCDQCDALTARVAELERGAAQWQPMTTAPKDGTSVLLEVKGEEHGCVIGFWSDPSIGDTVEEESGWYRSEADGHNIRLPTRWASLPPADGAVQK